MNRLEVTAVQSWGSSDNPYAAPAELDDETHPLVGESKALEYYRRFRRGSMMLLCIMLVFCVGVAIPMVVKSEHPLVEGVLVSLYCLVPVAGLIGVWRSRTAQQARLSYERLRLGAAMARQTCLLSGPCAVGVGLLTRWVLPADFHDSFSTMMVVCGIAIMACAFQFPRIPARPSTTSPN